MNESIRESRESDEIEIDLKKYAQRIWNGRYIIIALMVLGALLGGLFSFVAPADYEAVASVALIQSRTDVEFDARVKTTTSDDNSLTTLDARRNALLSLVSSGEIAQKVLNDVGSQLKQDEREPSKLIRMVKAELAQRGDLILIKARYSQADVATQIANLWAKYYEQYVNGVYSVSQPTYLASVLSEVDSSRKAYETTQQALEKLIAENNSAVLQRKIADAQEVIASLSAQRLASLHSTIQTRLDVQTQLIEIYLTAQREASTQSISQALNSQVKILSGYYETKIELSQLVHDAGNLRDQVAQGGANSVRSTQLTLVLLKARAFAHLNGESANRFQVQLNVNTPGATDPTVEDVLRDLDAFVAVLKARQQSVEKDITAASADLSSGQSLTKTLVTGKSTLQDSAAQQFEQLVNLKDLGNLVPASAMNSDAAFVVLLDKYAKDLDKAKSGLEAISAQMRDLTEQRDLNRDAYVSLLKKQNEVRIGTTLTSSEVRFASPAFVPDLRVTPRILPVGIGIVLGLLIGIIFALFRNATGSSPQPLSNTTRPLVQS